MKVIVFVSGEEEPRHFYSITAAISWAKSEGYDLEYHQKVPSPDPYIFDAVPRDAEDVDPLFNKVPKIHECGELDATRVMVFLPDQEVSDDPEWFDTKEAADAWAQDQNLVLQQYSESEPFVFRAVFPHSDRPVLATQESRRALSALLKEYVLLELEEVPKRKANDTAQLAGDSIDVELDRTIDSFDKSAKGQDGQLNVDKFVSDIAIAIDHIADQIDLKGAFVRRVANYLSKAYDEKVSKEVMRMLEDEFGVSSDATFKQSNVTLDKVPLSKDGGPEPSGAPPG